jgi:S-(hydroxymethyl)glutathione dehydrogenase/alcohol dehydrogenase
MQAAVLRQTGDTELDIVDDVTLVETGPGLVRVRIRATGVCHSDLSVMDGTIRQPAPLVIGHEGAGEVVDVGPAVTALSVGDHVIVAWVPPCGVCRWCLAAQPNLCMSIAMSTAASPKFLVGGQAVSGEAGCGTFAEEVLLPEQAVIPIAPDVPFDVASIIGCGVMTGVGAAINTARVRPGDSCIVFGCGGVGVSALQGCRIAGATTIVAVDLVEQKRDSALRFGATHAFAPEQVPDAINSLTRGEGFDHAIEAVGIPATIRGAYDAARRGGVVTVVGVGRRDQNVIFNAGELMTMSKTIHGSVYGGADVRVDFARMINLWKRGLLDLGGMISQRLGLSDVNRALADLRAGTVLRTVLEL